jgi:hypothetical protein
MHRRLAVLSILSEDISLKFDMIYCIVLKSKPSCEIDFELYWIGTIWLKKINWTSQKPRLTKLKSDYQSINFFSCIFLIKTKLFLVYFKNIFDLKKN